MKLQKGWYSKVKRDNLNRKNRIREDAERTDPEQQERDTEKSAGDIAEQDADPSKPAQSAANAQENADKTAEANKKSEEPANTPEQQDAKTEEKPAEEPASDDKGNDTASEWAAKVKQADEVAKSYNNIQFNSNDPKTFGNYLKGYCDTLFDQISTSLGSGAEQAVKDNANAIVSQNTQTEGEKEAEKIDASAAEPKENSEKGE